MWWLTILSRLPFACLYIFSDFLFVIAYYVMGYRKDVVLNNVRNSFPGMPDGERKKLVKAFYRNLCDYGVESLKLLTISADELKKRMFFKNPEMLEPFSATRQSFIILASHQFNWEWLLAAASASLGIPFDFVYQEQGSRLFNDFSLRCRSRFGAYPIRREQVARESIRRKDIVRGIAVVADQFPGLGHDKRYWTQFLNQQTAFFQGIEQLAHLTQYPVVFIAVKKIRRGFYEAEFQPVSTPPYEKGSHVVIENYVRQTEQVIRENPAGWLWSHKRWKDRF